MPLKKIKALAGVITYLDKNLGLTKLALYISLALFAYGILNIRSVVIGIIDISQRINTERHDRMMESRDELLGSLNPLLNEMRGTLGASRVLYFEYHNSKENLVGIPFKYVDLVLPVRAYEAPSFDVSKYKDINAGLITSLFQDLRKQNVVINKGPEDLDFDQKYPGMREFFGSRDGSVQQCFLSLPGINTPVGMILVEYVEGDETRDWVKIKEEGQKYIVRVNAQILKYSTRREKEIKEDIVDDELAKKKEGNAFLNMLLKD